MIKHLLNLDSGPLKYCDTCRSATLRAYKRQTRTNALSGVHRPLSTLAIHRYEDLGDVVKLEGLAD